MELELNPAVLLLEETFNVMVAPPEMPSTTTRNCSGLKSSSSAAADPAGWTATPPGFAPGVHPVDDHYQLHQASNEVLRSAIASAYNRAKPHVIEAALRLLRA